MWVVRETRSSAAVVLRSVQRKPRTVLARRYVAAGQGRKRAQRHALEGAQRPCNVVRTARRTGAAHAAMRAVSSALAKFVVAREAG